MAAEKVTVPMGLPRVLRDHVAKLSRGTRSAFKRGDVFVEKVERIADLSDGGAIQRLIKKQRADSWMRLEAWLGEPGEKWLPVVFDALWMADIDYEFLRDKMGGYKGSDTCEAARLVSEIEEIARKIESKLDRLTMVARATASRKPDRWPDSPRLRVELSDLLERCEKFQPGEFEDTALRAALSRRESSPANEYIRGVVALLNEYGFPFSENRTPPPGFVELCGAGFGMEEGVSENAVRRVLKEGMK